MSAYKTVERMRGRVDKLKQEFSECLDYFDKAQLFTGPSTYFHNKTLAIRKKYPSAYATLNDDDFFESLYATLTAWGMHRMGPGNAKLTELEEIKNSFRNQSDSIRKIESLNITELDSNYVNKITDSIWEIIAKLKVGIGETKIVANSKALHHLLPSLVPPIDREYTLRFFYNHTTLNQGDEKAFKEIFPFFHQIGIAKKKQIEDRIGKGMNTSESKVIDNAIVGFGRKYLKSKSTDKVE
jgi:hypothetical protein